MFSGVRKPAGITKTGAGSVQLGGVLSLGQAQVSRKMLSTVDLWLFSVANPHFPSEYGKPSGAGCGISILLRTVNWNTLDPTRGISGGLSSVPRAQ